MPACFDDTPLEAIEVCERVVEGVEVFAAGDVADDVTLVVLRRNR